MDLSWSAAASIQAIVVKTGHIRLDERVNETNGRELSTAEMSLKTNTAVPTAR